MKIDTIFFDLGNTLLWNTRKNSLQHAVHTLSETLLASGCSIPLEEFSEEYYRNLTYYYHMRDLNNLETDVYSILKETLIRLDIPAVTTDQAEAAIDAFYAITEENWQPVLQALPVLKSLQERNFKLGIITNASSDKDIRTLLQRNQLEPYFKTVAISAVLGYRKPHKKIFTWALNKICSTAESSMMVGDSLMADIAGAKVSGLRSVWYTNYSQESATNLHDSLKADAVMHDFAELPQIVDSFQ